MSDTSAIKELAVKEKRVWVRLTRLCNNGCMFCLDSDSQDGTMVPRDQVEQQIIKGREEGGQRLILSGGEASLHPDFVHFLKLGKQVGYDWLQTITNGRMFSYGKFARSALEAGLNEATFSMHGHTAELHDKLVGVDGAFMQSLKGMKNLAGQCVVNVDVVLNKLNIPHLKEILEFWIALGIHEFDLLHMVPFGRAWNVHRDELFYDPAEMLPHLSRGFKLRQTHKIYMWTNRLPAHYLEGNEDLIQDPHKIHDEVRGRIDMLRKWRDAGSKPTCMDDRCPYCAMDHFCTVLGETLASLAHKKFEQIRVGSSQLSLFRSLVEDGRLDQKVDVDLVVESADHLGEWGAQLAEMTGLLRLEAETLTALQSAVEWPRVATVTLHHLFPDQKEQLGALLGRNVGIRTRASSESAASIAGLGPEISKRLTYYLPTHEYLSQAKEQDPEVDQLKQFWSCAGSALEGVPPCLSGAGTGSGGAVDLTLLDDDGVLDLVRFTDWFIARKYFVKSLRCTNCRHYDDCRGLHINHARNYGFEVLQPIK